MWAVAALFLFSFPLNAQKPGHYELFGEQADDLVAKCRNLTLMDAGADHSSLDLGLCIGFVKGVADGSQLAATDPQKWPVCFPPGVTADQLVRVVLKYGQDHPERLHFYSANFVKQALQIAFPCPANASKTP